MITGPDATVSRGQTGKNRILLHLLIVALYATLAVLMTWPLAAHMGDAVPGPPGDNLEYAWKLWWFNSALLERHVSPLNNADIFYPFGYPVALSETTMVHTVLGLPLTALLGEVVAYNTMMLLSYVFSAWAVYLLCRELGSSRLAAFIAGLAFAFCPYRLSHMGAGHLPLMGTAWIALLLLALERLIRRPTVGRGLLVGLAYALMGLSSWYYAAMGGFFAAIYLLLRARPWREHLLRWPFVRALLMGGVLAAILMAPAALPILRLYSEGQASYETSLAYLDRWSASPLDFLYPNAMHSLWGEPLTRAYYQNINENLLYLGAVTLALAAIGAWARRRQYLTRVYVWVALLACLLAMGTTLHFAGKPVYLPVPSQVEQLFARGMYFLTGKLALNKVSFAALRRPGAIVLPLPTLLLYLFVPLMNAMRVWARFGIVAMLAVAVLAAWGVDHLLARLGSQWVRMVLAVVVAILILLDLTVVPYPYGYTEAREQPVDEWLALQPDEGAVLHYPLDKTWFGWMLYPNRVHGHPLAYGYGTFAPQPFEDAAPALAAWPSEGTLQMLRDWGVKYVAVGAVSYGDDWPTVEQAMEDLPLTKVGVFADEPLFHGDRLLRLVPPTADVPATELVNGDRQVYLHDEIHLYVIQ